MLGTSDITVDPFGERGELSQITIADNQSGGRIAVTNLSGDSTANVVEIMVLNNTLSGDLGGIEINGGESGNNIVMAEIRGNTVQASSIAINVRGGTLDGGVGGDNNLIDAMIIDNLVTNADFRAIAIQGGSGAGSGSESDNIVMNTIRNNTVQTSSGGIRIEGGALGESNNIVSATITENVITNSALSSIYLQSGASDAFDNTIMAEVQSNRVDNAGDRGMFMLAGSGASNNLLDTLIADNTVTGSDREGILVAGGVVVGASGDSAQQNEAMGMVVDNMVQNSGGTGIAVVAGLLVVGTDVTGNVAREDLIGNTADGLTCEDGLAGNTAECTLQNNTDTTNSSLSHPNRLSAVQQSVSPVLTQLLTRQIERLEQKDAELRTRAAQIDDDRLRQRLLGLCDKLEALRDKLAARRDGRSPWEEHVSID